jgi:hypothetical protein
VWDLWWTEWCWDRVFTEYFGFPCQNLYTNVPYSLFHLLPTLYNAVREHANIDIIASVSLSHISAFETVEGSINTFEV